MMVTLLHPFQIWGMYPQHNNASRYVLSLNGFLNYNQQWMPLFYREMSSRVFTVPKIPPPPPIKWNIRADSDVQQLTCSPAICHTPPWQWDFTRDNKRNRLCFSNSDDTVVVLSVSLKFLYIQSLYHPLFSLQFMIYYFSF
jgi:hypothetical protein